MFTISACPSGVQAISGSRPKHPGARGGAEGIRTPDLRLAKAALSQLSYGPFWLGVIVVDAWVGQPGFEPGTSVLSGPRSNRLSYTPLWTTARFRVGTLTGEE